MTYGAGAEAKETVSQSPKRKRDLEKRQKTLQTCQS